MKGSAPRPVALTCGEPAGIGAEITAKAWDVLRQETVFFWIGDPTHLPPETPFETIATPDLAAAVMQDALPVIPHDFGAPRKPGVPNPAHAQPVIDVIARAVAFERAGEACALCTAPIHKAALKAGAAFAYPGHTEYLAALAGVTDAVMMLVSPQLRVVPATIHIPLAEVPAALTPKLLGRTIEITHGALKTQFGLANPRLVVAGLNPHAGEAGAIGTEEQAWITDLVASFADQGMKITGPHPGDTLFHAAARARYDAVIAMYHDQALIPIKTLDFDRGVNVTLGLPFIRTSPDHGTAFDIADRNIANPTSLIEALRLAWAMAHSAA